MDRDAAVLVGVHVVLRHCQFRLVWFRGIGVQDSGVGRLMGLRVQRVSETSEFEV
jgi:hypothetical protein